MTRRVVSLLPSATEMVVALEAIDQLVGVSHECDYPEEVRQRPAVTYPAVEFPSSSAGVDATVRDRARRALSIYEVDRKILRDLDPGLVITQDLCRVCAVSRAEVEAAVRAEIGVQADVLALSPTTLGDVWSDLVRVGTALGKAAEAQRLREELESRCAHLASEAAGEWNPEVLTLEWLDPLMVGGTWMPELVELAGGVPLVARRGESAPTLSREDLAQLDPDWLVIKPCGYGVERTLDEQGLLQTALPWSQWRACRKGRVAVVDGNLFFNRPGPRLVESLEILLSLFHPQSFPELVERHQRYVQHLDPEGRPIGS